MSTSCMVVPSVIKKEVLDTTGLKISRRKQSDLKLDGKRCRNNEHQYNS